MKTNNIIRILAAGALLLSTACSDMLEISSKTAHETNIVYESLTLTEQAVVGIYPTFKQKAFFNYMTADNDETLSNLNGNERAGLSNYTFAAGSSQMQPVLENRYAAINRANEVIDGIETYGTMDDSEEGRQYKALYGEALACRAWAFFDIVRFYGDAPMPLTPSRSGDDFHQGRVSRDIIYDQIIGDLQQAANLVPWQSEFGHHDRITKAGVYGFLARIALHAAGYSLRWDLETYDPASMHLATRSDEARRKELYQIARDACQAIMSKGENSLLSEYVDIFKHVHNNEYDAETIFQLGNYGTNGNDGVGYSMGLSIGGSSPVGYISASTLIRVTAPFFLSFDENDIRRDVTCVNYALAGTTGFAELQDISNYGCGKWRKSWSKTQGPAGEKTDINWIMIRYADILLMFAEAENELNNGPTAAAKDVLKQIRDRAFPNDKATMSAAYVEGLTTKDAFFNALVQERAWELGSESNLRRTDLIRWNLLAKTIEKTRAAMKTIYNDHKNPWTNEPLPVYQVYEKVLYGQNLEPLCIESTPSDDEVENDEQNNIYCVKWISDNLNTFSNRFAQSFVEAKSELMPFNQSMIDTNKGLANQQHPGFK